MIAGQPLTHCPVCKYDLTGLPKNHRCPECGFEYDETMLVWYARRPSWWGAIVWLFVLGLMGFIPLGIVFVLSARTLGSPILPAPLISGAIQRLLVLTLAWSPIILATVVGRRKPAFVVVADDALYTRSVFGARRKFSWEHLAVPPCAEDADETNARRIDFHSRSVYGWLRSVLLFDLFWTRFEFVFHIVSDRHGQYRRPVQLGPVASGAASRTILHQAIHARWKRFHEGRVGSDGSERDEDLSPT